MANQNLTVWKANPTPDKDPRYITAREIGERIGRTPRRVGVSLARGHFPFKPVKRVGSYNYYDRELVEDWIDRGAPTLMGYMRIPPKGK